MTSPCPRLVTSAPADPLGMVWDETTHPDAGKAGDDVKSPGFGFMGLV
jgi:hypothetical protein